MILHRQLKHIMNHETVGYCQVRELYLFSHPYVDQEYHCTERTPDAVKTMTHFYTLLRNWFIVATLTGILEAYVCVPFSVRSIIMLTFITLV